MKSTSSYITSTIIFVLGVIAVGYITSAILAHRIDHAQRQLLLIQAKQAALVVSTQDVTSLAGSEVDLSNPVYQRLKALLTQFRASNSEIRFVYLMGYHPEVRTQFFYVDSEPTTSDDYSPPGQLFGDTREQDIKQYLAGEPYTDGPYRDSWGEWVSGYVPLHDQQGAVVAMVGIDIATSVWHDQVNSARVMIGIIVLLLSILVIIVSRHFYKKQRAIGDLSKENRRLEQEDGTLRHMQKLAQLGSFTIHFPDGGIVIDEQFRLLFKSTRLDKDEFRSFIHLDDQEKFESMLKEITTSNIIYSWVDVRIGTPEAGFRKYHIYGNIERHASGPAERFEGVMQDITDIDK